ncbi:hypothetical protein [Arthrobacter sp. NyZ413]|uniref:hypothetical protein n=1 Tax=Arthrobacter sp. NyZ413 TaxID=3144669 RepID=UPI003BF81FDC
MPAPWAGGLPGEEETRQIIAGCVTAAVMACLNGLGADALGALQRNGPRMGQQLIKQLVNDTAVIGHTTNLADGRGAVRKSDAIQLGVSTGSNEAIRHFAAIRRRAPPGAAPARKPPPGKTGKTDIVCAGPGAARPRWLFISREIAWSLSFVIETQFHGKR